MAVAEPPIRRKKGSAGTRSEAMPWWGDRGPAPHLQWPGVTIEIPATYSTKRQRWESPDGKYYFDANAAADACEFFPAVLRHHIGEFAGRPFHLRPDQDKLLTRPIFGWKRASDGMRRIRKVFGFCPKGWGKSPWAAGTGLYLARCDKEIAAEVYALAADRENARTVHDNAKIMVESSPLLMKGCEITKNAIVWDSIRSTYKVLSADASRAHGFRPSAAIFDEMHAQKNRDLYEAIKKSMVKRRQPLMIIITHSGTDDESICYEEYEYATHVLSGSIVDDTCLPVIFEAKPKDDWTDPEVWKRVNPGYGTTVKADGIEQECIEAKNEPRKVNDFLRYHLNRWVNQATAWIPVDWWDACEPEPISDYRQWLQAQAPQLATLPCAAGLDLAQKIDLACFNVVFRLKLDGPAVTVEAVSTENDQPVKKTIDLNYRVVMVPFFWIPEETMREHEKNDGVPYSHWAELGLVTPTEGAIIDYSKIYSDITTKILPMFPRLKQGIIGYDPAFATDIATQLRDKAGLKVLEVLQNYTHLSEVCYLFEALVKGKRVSHGGHRTFRNHVEHVAIKTDDARRIRPVKPKKAGKHIDGVVSGLMGLKALAGVPDQKKSYALHFLGGAGHAADKQP